jgi:hypothetical protein
MNPEQSGGKARTQRYALRSAGRGQKAKRTKMAHLRAFVQFRTRCHREKRTPEQWMAIIKKTVRGAFHQSYAAGVVAFQFSDFYAPGVDWSPLWEMSRAHGVDLCPCRAQCEKILAAILPPEAAQSLIDHLRMMEIDYDRTCGREANMTKEKGN